MPGAKHSADCQLCYQGASGFELVIPLWLPIVGLEAQTTEDDEPQHVTLDSELQFAIVAEARLRLGPVGLSLSANGVSLGSSAVRSSTDEVIGEVDLDMYFGRATLSWNTPPIEFTTGERTALFAIWPYLGVRYAILSGDGSNQDGALIFDGTLTWGEPLVGIEILLDLRRGWLFELRADLGGFSVGSKLSFWSAAGLRYALTDWFNLRVGWTAYYVRLDQDNVEGSFLLHGPGIGLGVPLF